MALVTSPVYWRQTLGLDGEKLIDDAIAGTSMRALGERGYRLVGIDVDLGAPNRRQFEVLRQKQARQGVDWRAIKEYGPPSRKKGRARRTQLARLRRAVGEDAICRRGMRYRDIDFAPLLVGRFSYLFAHYIEEALGYLDALENALARDGDGEQLRVFATGLLMTAMASNSGFSKRQPA